jgi:hypothetical protein
VGFNIAVPDNSLYPAAIPWHRGLLLLTCSCAVGFSEELSYRAYLIPRLEEVMGSTWKSITLSAALFGFAHFYQGYFGIACAVVAAMVYGVSFCVARRVWPLAISHAIGDFVIFTQLSSTLG